MRKVIVQEFEKGDRVKFAMKQSKMVRDKNRHYVKKVVYLRGVGRIVKLVPKDAMQGDARLTVELADGTRMRPFPSQCKPA